MKAEHLFPYKWNMADVSVNIFAHLEAQRTGRPVQLCCAIGDTEVGGVPYV